jgi:hypothetical protein
VLRLERERFEDQEIECSLGKFHPGISHRHPFCFDKRLTPVMSKRKGSSDEAPITAGVDSRRDARIE